MAATEKDKYRELFSLYDLAENKIKIIEQLSNEGLFIPSVNQLRYAGQHTLLSILSDDENETENNIYEAKDHCKRAIYDALEIGIVYLLRNIELFHEDYRFITVTDVIPDYLEKLKRINEYKNIINNTSRQSISNNYEKLQDIFDDLNEIVKELEIARTELNKKFNNWRRAILFTVSTIGVALIAILVSILLKCL